MDIEVFVEGEGAKGIEIVRIQAGSPRRVIVEQFAGRHGLRVEDALLFVEDEDQSLDLAPAGFAKAGRFSSVISVQESASLENLCFTTTWIPVASRMESSSSTVRSLASSGRAVVHWA
jgi:hypothetical protein